MTKAAIFAQLDALAAAHLRPKASIRFVWDSGGTVPRDAIQRASGSPTISVPIASHDHNQHAANEKSALEEFMGRGGDNGCLDEHAVTQDSGAATAATMGRPN